MPADYLFQFSILFTDSTIYTATIDMVNRANISQATTAAQDAIQQSLPKYAQGRTVASFTVLSAVRPPVGV